MIASTTLHAVTLSNSEPLNLPVILRNGLPDVNLQVTSLVSQAPLDERNATVISHDVSAFDLIPIDEPLTVAWPWERWDGEARTLVWLNGQLTDQRIDATGHQTWQIADAWSDALQQPMATLLAEAAERWDVHLDDQLAVGTLANASTSVITINGQRICYPAASITTMAWTVGTALQWLNVLGSLELDCSALGEIKDRPLTERMLLRSTLGDVLRQFCDTTGLVIIRRMATDDMAGEKEQRLVLQHNRTPLADGPVSNDDPGLKQLEQQQMREGARRWIAYAGRPVVEGTWTLVGGWSPALEDENPDLYSRATSNDFHVYRDVFRRWVLNEHGQWSQPPFNRSAAVQLEALFEQPTLPPQPLTLEPCLTQDDTGRSRGLVLEVSTDSGQNWSAYAGRYETLTDEAGVYLDDDTLDTAIVDAAITGTLRLRVTASLHSPQRLTASRWSGNALHGHRPSVTWHAGDGLGWQRLDATSIHASDVAAGTLTASLRDDRHALQYRLDEYMQSHPDRESDASWTWTIAGLQPWLTAGLRVNRRSISEAEHRLSVNRATMHCHVNQAIATTTVELIQTERTRT